MQKADRSVYLPLCFRCHHRAQFLETGGQWRPRYQCGEIKKAVVSCYMYRPPRPLVMKPEDGDQRPLGGPAMISARMRALGESNGEWQLRKVLGGWVMEWR